MEPQHQFTLLHKQSSEITQPEPDPNPNPEPEPEPERTIASTTTSSVHSPASSPSHEFSFTISLHSTNTTMTTTTTPSSPSLSSKPNHRQTPSAIDLTPADDIFFHGHLLPLHFLSHLHATSPRSSTTSLDSFTLPATQPKPILKPVIHSFPQERPKSNTNRSHKSKSFSLSALAKWIKGSESKEKSKKTKFDVTQFVKRYINIIKPLLSPRGPGAGSVKFPSQDNQTYSFSGSLSPRLHKRDLRSLRGELSAPASMRTSPTNSGRLLPNVNAPSPVSESTMEELQSAIQAAIAHCKNSTTSVQDKSSNSSPVPVN